jgi:Tfp pilus assembly protein PilP
MFGGMSPRRLALYGAAVAALIALNLAGWQREDPENGATRGAPKANLMQMPDLHMAREFESVSELGTRDLFSRRPLPASAEPKPATVAQRPAPPPDPRDVAMSKARELLGDIRLIGVMSAGDSSLAVLYHKGNTTNRAVGDEIVPGYKLDRITRDDVQLRNEDVGVAAVLSMGGRKPMQLIRVD